MNLIHSLINLLQEFKENPAQVMYIILAVFAMIAAVVLIQKLTAFKYRINTSDSGLERIDTNGKKGFIAWDDISRIEEKVHSQKLYIHIRSNGQKIAIDFQCVDFQKTYRKIIEEAGKRRKFALPAVFKGDYMSYNPNIMAFWIFVIAIILIVGYFLYATSNRPVIFLFMGLLLIPAIIITIMDSFIEVKEIIVERSEFTAVKSTSRKTYQFKDIAALDYLYVYEGYKYNYNSRQLIELPGASRSPEIEITMNDGVVTMMKKGRLPLIDVYMCLKKVSGIKVLGEKS